MDNGGDRTNAYSVKVHNRASLLSAVRRLESSSVVRNRYWKFASHSDPVTWGQSNRLSTEGEIHVKIGSEGFRLGHL